MKNEIPLGKLIVGEAARDAIHIAVAPVVATQDLWPGTRVGIIAGTVDRVSADAQPHIGIIDPFLPARVAQGEACFLCLFPNTITSLRHEWVHPAFDGRDKLPTQEQVNSALLTEGARQESEIWLRKYAVEMNSYDKPDQAFDRLVNGLRTGELFSHGGRIMSGLYDLENADDLRFHAERYLGIRIEWGDFKFSCSC